MGLTPTWRKGLELLDEGMALAENDEVKRRVEKVSIAPRTVLIEPFARWVRGHEHEIVSNPRVKGSAGGVLGDRERAARGLSALRSPWRKPLRGMGLGSPGEGNASRRDCSREAETRATRKQAVSQCLAWKATSGSGAGSSLIIALDRADPDVAEPNRVAMILKQDRPLGTMRPVVGQRTVCHGADQGRVIVYDDTVVEYSCVRGRLERAVCLEAGGREQDVIGLPLSWLARRIDQWWVLSINRRGMAVGIGQVIERVKDLNLIPPKEHDAAIAPTLVPTYRRNRGGEFEMELAIAKLLVA